jgi:hypothetical protein
MPFPPSFAPVLRALLRDLRAAEYSLFLATRKAGDATAGRVQLLLENQARDLHGFHSQVACQLVRWSEGALPGPDADPRPDLPQPALGVASPGQLRDQHADLIGQLNRFIVRTSRLGDADLTRMLDELLAAHSAAAELLLQEDSPALPADDLRFDPFPRSTSLTPTPLFS